MPASGTKIRPTPSGFMMNGPMWSLGCESALKSGTSLPTQRLLRFVPPDLAAIGVPGLAVHVAGRAVVHHAAIHRPGPGPVGINAQARTDRRCRAAASAVRLRSTSRTTASCRDDVEPSSRKKREARQLLAGLDHLLAWLDRSHRRSRGHSALWRLPTATDCWDRCSSTSDSESDRGTCRLPSDTARAPSGKSAPGFPGRAWRRPGGGTAAHFHCSQRAELTKVPSFSAKPAPGSR